MGRSKHGPWLALALTLSAALTMAGCQDSYPIEATSCDRYCDLGLAPGCGEYSPTGCVLTCEATWGWSRQYCSDELEDWVSCLKEHEHRLICGYAQASTADGCESTQLARDDCMRAHFIAPPADWP